MKKFTSALLAVTALTAANVFAAGAVDSKTGAYVGGNVGMANTNVKYDFANQNFSQAARKQSTKFDGGKLNPLFGLMAGYGMQVGSMYFGGEIYGGFDSAKVTPYDDSGSGYKGGLWKSSVKRTNFYGLAGRFGAFITPSTMMYVKLGIEGGKWKTTINPNADTINNYVGATNPTAAQKEASKLSITASKNSISFVPGVGFDMFVNKNLFVRAEYSYLFGPKISSLQNTLGYNNDLVDGDGVKHTFKITQQTFKVGVGYKF